MATALDPLTTDMAEVVARSSGVRGLLFVIMEIASARVGDPLRVFDLQSPAENVEEMHAVVAQFAIRASAESEQRAQVGVRSEETGGNFSSNTAPLMSRQNSFLVTWRRSPSLDAGSWVIR